jgi:hypothetical protein
MALPGPFIWQGRLESEGRVVFGSRWFSLFTGSGQLTVTHEGLLMGKGPVVPFDRVTAVSTSRGKLTAYYTPGPGQRLNPLERRSGQKRLLLGLPRLGSVRPEDLAVWLLKLKGGPMTEIDVELGGMARVFRIRDQGDSTA